MIAIFLFFNVATGKQAGLAFSSDFKHCNVITFDGEAWVNIDFDREGIKTRVLEVSTGSALIRGLKMIKPLSAMLVVDIGERKKISWKPFWVRSCNELDRYLTGVDIGFTFNPVQLYRKLLKYSGKRNYHVIHAWRREYGHVRRRRGRLGERIARPSESANQRQQG